MRIVFSETASRQIRSFERVDQELIADKLRFWTSQSNPLVFAKRLVGEGVYRFRVGDLRILFLPKGDIVYIVTIIRRDKAYRKLD